MSEVRKDLSNPLTIDQLYLIAQFFCDTEIEAADLVERTLRATQPASFTEQIATLVSLAESNRSGPLEYPGLIQDSRLPIPESQVSRFIQGKIKDLFFGFSPTDRLSVWAATSGLVEWQGPGNSFPDEIRRNCSPSELRVYGRWLTDAVVGNELDKFWAGNFGTVPPALRSVLESKARRSAITSDSGTETRPSLEKTKLRPSLISKKAVIYFILIITTAFIGYTINRQSRRGMAQGVSKSIVDEVIERAGHVDPDLHTLNAEQAERYIRDSFSRRIRIPTLTGLELAGVGTDIMQDSVRIPVLVFHSDSDDSATSVFVFSYAIFLSTDTQHSLPSGTLSQIENTEAVDIQVSPSGNAVIWRQADDIFIAVTGEDPALFARRRLIE